MTCHTSLGNEGIIFESAEKQKKCPFFLFFFVHGQSVIFLGVQSSYQSGKCRDGKHGLSGSRSIWESFFRIQETPSIRNPFNLGIFLWDTGNTVYLETVQSGKFSLGYGKHPQYKNSSIWEIFFGIRETPSIRKPFNLGSFL